MATSDPAHPQEWQDFRSILLVRPDNMGDVLMTTPAIRAVRQMLPGCRLTLLASSAGAMAARHIPDIDDTIIFDAPWTKNDTVHESGLVTAMARELKQRRFDGAILFTTYSQNPLPAAMLCYLAGIPRLLGYCHENPYALISDWRPDPEPDRQIRHEVQRQLDLVGSIGATTSDTALRLDIDDKAVASAGLKLADAGVDVEKPWLILHAGVSEEKRRYPAASYAQAAGQLAHAGWQIVLTGSPSEKDYVTSLCRQIRAASGNHTNEAGADATHVFDLAGELSFEELAAAIQSCHVLVSNNTGPVHMAAAVGTPVVVLYAMTNPQHTPWQVPSEVLYFPVPEQLHSRNYFLQNFPGPDGPQASPAAIVRAVRRLASQRLAERKVDAPRCLTI